MSAEAAAAPVIPVAPLTPEGFAPYGEVIAATPGRGDSMNGGTAERFHALGRIWTAAGDDGGGPILSIARVSAQAMPRAIAMVERHPLGTQAFAPMDHQRMLVIVAAANTPEPLAPAVLRGFVTDGRQGVNYRAGVWHAPLVALDGPGDFLLVERGGTAPNCDEFHFAAPVAVAALTPPPRAAAP